MAKKRKTFSVRKRKGRSVLRGKKLRDVESKEVLVAPHSFVISRGIVGTYIGQLVRDFRKIMEPYTASSLKVSRRNKIKDFLSVAGLLHVTHTVLFTRSDHGINLKVARNPRGPTLTFKVYNYTLSKDIASFSKKFNVFPKQFENSPLVVLNGFSGEGRHLHLMTKIFQNMFPAINLIKVDLSTIRRCLLFNYDPATKLIDIRHYVIKIVPTGVSKGVKKLLVNKVPDLSHYDDISDFIKNPTLLSESEVENDQGNEVVLPQKLSSRVSTGVSAIRLIEIGPRLTIQLMKAESGFLSGDVLYHDYIQKSEKEVQNIKTMIQEKKKIKEKRRKIQEENVRRKQFKKARMSEEKSGKRMHIANGNNKKEYEDEEEDENEWYKKEVGEESEPGLFPESQAQSKKKSVKKFKRSVGAKKIGFGTNPKKGESFKKKTFKAGKGKR